MSSAKTRLALIAGLAVVLAMVAATIAFNLFIGWKIESDATADLKYALDLDEQAVGTGRAPNYLILDENYGVIREGQPKVSEEEEKLAGWFSKHPGLYSVERVAIDGWVCYAVLCSLADYAFEDDGWGDWGRHEAGYFVAYIDTAAEQALVSSVNTAFALIGVLGALIAAAAGYAAGRRIEQSQEAQKRFYENMSHELKTPLAAIRGYAEGAAGGVVDGDAAMRAIERESGKMANMIDEILGLSRLEAGAVQLHRETLDVGDFIQDCLMPFEGAVRAKGLEVELDLASGTVEADCDLFDHAFSNVLTNAVRHAENTVRIAYDGSAIRVANDGALPNDEQLAHLFDRFYAGEGGSTGIGLAIAREIVSLHGWNMEAHIEGPLLVMAIRFQG